MTKRKLLKISLISALLIVVSIRVGLTSESKSNVDSNEEQLQRIFKEVKRTVQLKDFNILQKYASKKSLLYWGRCNSDDSTELSFDNMVRELKEDIQGADISVTNHIDSLIETEGWTGEYPYLYFDFSKVGNKWTWRGVCYDTERSLDYRQALGEEKANDMPPKLPRPGSRVFKDLIALKTRIIEILKFKAFDELKPYATENKILVGNSCPATLDRNELINKGVPVEQVIEFLKKNAAGSNEITPHKMWSYKRKPFITSGCVLPQSEMDFQAT